MKKQKAFSLIELSIVILIIGILIAGVTQGSRLVSAMRLTAAKSLTRSSPVASIKNLTIWLETSSDESITGTVHGLNVEDNEAVTTWNDINPQLSSKINPTQATGANQPIYVVSGIGNLPSIKFDGVNDYLSSGSTVPLLAGDQTYTMIMVWKSIPDATPTELIVNQGTNALNLEASIFTSSATLFGFSGDGNDYVTAYVQGNNMVTVIKVDNTAANNISIYNNSNTAVSGASTTPASLNLSAADFAVGARVVDHQFPFSGLVSEIIFFDRVLKQSEVQDINVYLGKKYGIKIS
jgi:prepilin-type N-terminal cleavage/methylation domain-containing protein